MSPIEKGINYVFLVIGTAGAILTAIAVHGLLEYIAVNFTVRNISYHQERICKGKATHHDHDELLFEFQMYEEYKGHAHRYTVMKDPCSEY